MEREFGIGGSGETAEKRQRGGAEKQSFHPCHPCSCHKGSSNGRASTRHGRIECDRLRVNQRFVTGESVELEQIKGAMQNHLFITYKPRGNTVSAAEYIGNGAATSSGQGTAGQLGTTS